MGHLSSATVARFSLRTPKSVGLVGTPIWEDLEEWAAGFELDEDFEDALALATAVDIRRFGAPDGGGDATAALAAAVAEGVSVLIPHGTFTTEETVALTVASQRLFGMGQGASVLKMADGAGLNVLVRCGAASGSTVTSRVGVAHLTLDGNESNNSAASPDAVLRVYNCELSAFDDIEAIEAEGVGIHATTDHIDRCTRNYWSRLRLSFNNVGGGLFEGLKYNTFQSVGSDNNNTGYGLKFGEGASGTIEFTQCIINNIIVNGNGDDAGSVSERAGLILQGTARMVVSNVQSLINGGPGISMRNGTVGACSGVFSNWDMRRNAEIAAEVYQGVEIQDSAVSGGNFSNLRIQGGTVGGGDKIGFYANAMSRFSVKGVHCVSVNGPALVLEDCTRGSVSGYTGISCGDSTATTNHGIHIKGSSDLVTLSDLFGNNSQTTGTNFELKIDTGCKRITLGSGITMIASTDGNEIDIAAGAEEEVTILPGAVWRDTGVTPTVASAATLTLPPQAYNSACTVTGTTDITAITAMPTGTRVTLVFTDGTPGDIIHGNNIFLAGGANFSPAQNDAITLIQLGANLYQSGP